MVERLILASASPRRRDLLASLGAVFDVIPAEVTEFEDPAMDPEEMVSRNAALKAEWVSARHPDAWVLGADTTVYIDGHALNKPADAAEARSMLRRLSGRTHTVFTGLILLHGNRNQRIERGVASHVTFLELDDAIIENYLQHVHTLDKAGGYAIQQHSDWIVARHEGSFSNIIGLPLTATKQILTELGLLA